MGRIPEVQSCEKLPISLQCVASVVLSSNLGDPWTKCSGSVVWKKRSWSCSELIGHIWKPVARLKNCEVHMKPRCEAHFYTLWFMSVFSTSLQNPSCARHHSCRHASGMFLVFKIVRTIIKNKSKSAFGKQKGRMKLWQATRAFTIRQWVQRCNVVLHCPPTQLLQ